MVSENGEASLSNCTLGVTNLQDYSRSSGFSFGVSGVNLNGTPQNAVSNGSVSVSYHTAMREGLTYSVVSRGTIEIRDATDAQAAAITATLSRDADN